MFRELLSIFRGEDPLADVGRDFATMVGITGEMTLDAGRIFFREDGAPEGEAVAARDILVNTLQEQIRRAVTTHLAVSGNQGDLPYCLLLTGLVKDVERLGDYAKNLLEIVSLHPAPLPAGPELDELAEIRRAVEDTYRAVAGVFAESRRDEALRRIREGQETASRCDRLIRRVAAGEQDAATTTALILGARYYKRIDGHLLNILSSVVLPLDRVDAYDEDPS